MNPGQNFTKTWTIKNTGTTTWNSSYKLRYVSGQLSERYDDVPINGTVAPNQTYTFSVPMKAPDAAGTYREDWKVVNPSGTPILLFFAQIVVKKTEAPPPATTAQTPCPDALGFSPPLRDGKWIPTQSFANYLSTTNWGQTYNGYHSGEDWALSGGVSSGKPVYAIGTGRIVKIRSLEKSGLGHLVAIEHTGSFTIPGKSETINGQSYTYNTEPVKKIYSVYLHITPLPRIAPEQCVENGEQIGTIANIAHPHLHFEIRHPNQKPSKDWSLVGEQSNWQKYPNTQANNGYYINLQSMVDGGVRHPSEFIAANGEKEQAESDQDAIRETTPVPTPTPSAQTQTTTRLTPTSRGEPVHVLGEPWEQEEVSLNVIKIEIRSENDSSSAAAGVWFRFFSKTGQKLLVEIDWKDIHLEDNLGNRYVDWEGSGTTSDWVESGESLDFDRYYTRRPGERSRVPSDAKFVQVVVDRFSRISGACWQFDINPFLAPIAAPSPGTVKGIGDTWKQEGLALTLKNIEIRSESDSSTAAARAWFTLVNRTNERLLVEIDFGHIYLVDSFGRRFGDSDGGGLTTQWLDPGESWEFDRYYSEMAGERSRITRGAEFVLVVAENISHLARAQWKVDIASALSSMPSPGSGTIHVLGEPWEQEKVSLNVIKIEIRSENDSSSAAAGVWFRFFSKTGQKLLVEIDWKDIHLEDNLGNRYVDWEGSGTTSDWVESGESLDFDRYYTRRPGERSRVPSNAEFVRVVVDRFSRISDARWQFDINPKLPHLASPSPGTVKRVDETWERGGLALTLKNIEIRSESDSSAAAARAWFTLVNRTNERLLVEIDSGYIYLMDSFGRRFSDDSDGGGMTTQWLDPGESWEFDRYYSEMAGERSRITRGAEFVLVKIDKLGPIEEVQWQVDIVR
jgi:murein DD-endopeptidase MepM/ murein hydrolase activator NlpD